MRLPVSIIRAILTLLQQKKSCRFIASTIGISKSVVNKLNKRIHASGQSVDELCALSDKALLLKLYPRKKALKNLKDVDWESICQWLNNKHVNLLVAYEPLLSQKPSFDISYPYFCRKYREWRKENKGAPVITNNTYIAGEKMEIDYSGDLLPWIDEHGEIHKAHIFVACLPYSGYLFAYATADEETASWVEGVIADFDFCGGCPKVLVVDNAKALVRTASKEEGTVTAIVKDLCDHYNITPWSCKPYSPKEKNRVEASVRLVQTWVQGQLESAGPVFTKNLMHLNKRILEKVVELNARPLSAAKQISREKRFLEEELPLLNPLPETKYEVCDWLILVVDKSHCIKIHRDKGHRYSVPASYVHKKVNVRLSDEEVRIFDADTHKEIGSHQRCYEERGCKTHILEAHLTESEKNRRREPQYFVSQFVKKGVQEAVARNYVDELWTNSGNFVSRQRLHAVTRKLLYMYCPEILTEAMAEAIEFRQFSYKFLKELVELKEQQRLRQTNFNFSGNPSEEYDYVTPSHNNVRKYE